MWFMSYMAVGKMSGKSCICSFMNYVTVDRMRTKIGVFDFCEKMVL